MLLCQVFTHLFSRRIEKRVVHVAVGPREINEFEKTHCFPLALRTACESHSPLVNDDHLSRLQFVCNVTTNRPERTALACNHESVSNCSCNKWSDSGWIAKT